MSDVDWICESCTFINSGLITNCEICGALREAAGPGPSKWSVAGPDDPIILSDGEEGTDAEVDNKDVINLVDDDQGASACRSQRAGPGQGPIAATRNRSRTCLRDQRNPDIMVIKDDDDGDEGDVGSLARPSGTQPTGGYRDTLAFTGETSCQDASGEVYALDNCSCAVKLQHLAEQLRPAVTAAAMILSSAKPAIASAALVPKAATPCATLFDLAKSLLCPSGCGRWLSSRDVRLLLGPLKTAVLYYALCAALRREGKGSKAVAATAADSGGDALLRGECAAGHLPKGSAASGTAERCAAPNDAVARLLALSPSCPGCRRRMLPVCVLDQSRAQLEQTPPSQRQQPMPAGPSSARLSYHTALEQAIGHVASEHPTAMAVHLREALVARGQPPPPATASVEQLGSLLRNTLGPRCSFLCLGCSRNLETEVLSKTQLQELQSTSDKAFRALKLLGRVRAVLLNTQEDGVEDDEEGDEEGAEADAGGCAGRQSTVLTRAAGSGKESTKGRRRDGNKRRCKRRRLDDPSNAWAKGVGYGGSDGSCGSDNVAAVKAAQERQREADDEVRSCLKALLAVISPSGYPGGGGGGGDGGRALASPPPLLHAVLQYGGLPYVLRLLFQNDSLLDMGQREGMYREAMALVK
ncbi:hypothetical protein Vafri_21833 [Volvox africanus]|nr:hypothetical protein Vafri_21833 [Volvox africanus]